MKNLIAALAGLALLAGTSCTDQGTSPTDGLDLTPTDGTMLPTGDPMQVIEAFSMAFHDGDFEWMAAILDESFSYSVCDACGAGACGSRYPWNRARFLAALESLFADWWGLHFLVCDLEESEGLPGEEWEVPAGLFMGFSRHPSHRYIGLVSEADFIVGGVRGGELRIVGIRERGIQGSCFSAWLCDYDTGGGLSN
jgi:hypothetical protein